MYVMNLHIYINVYQKKKFIIIIFTSLFVEVHKIATNIATKLLQMQNKLSINVIFYFDSNYNLFEIISIR